MFVSVCTHLKIWVQEQEKEITFLTSDHDVQWRLKSREVAQGVACAF